MKTYIGTAGTPKVDTTGDMRPELEVRLEYALGPFDGLAGAPRLHLQGEPGCECGHSAAVHSDHREHDGCSCEGYMPVQEVPRCASCGHREALHALPPRGCAMHGRGGYCPCSIYDPREDRP